VAGQGLGGQHRRHGQGPRLGDQLPVEDVGERALDAVVDGATAARGRVNMFTHGHRENESRRGEAG